MAHWLFTILLVLNLLLFAWGYRHPVSDSGTLPPISGDEPPLQLLSERPASASHRPREPERMPGQENELSAGVDTDKLDREDRPGAPSAMSPALASETMCVRLGPLREETAALDLIVQLAKGGLEAELLTETAQQQSGFWVLIPPGEGPVATLVSNLEMAGIHDVWHFTKGELAGFVSLGLYSDQAVARKRLEELDTKHFKGEIRPRTIDETRFWVAVTRLQEDEAADRMLEAVFTRHPSFSYPSPPCSSESGN